MQYYIVCIDIIEWHFGYGNCWNDKTDHVLLKWQDRSRIFTTRIVEAVLDDSELEVMNFSARKSCPNSGQMKCLKFPDLLVHSRSSELAVPAFLSMECVSPTCTCFCKDSSILPSQILGRGEVEKCETLFWNSLNWRPIVGLLYSL